MSNLFPRPKNAYTHPPHELQPEVVPPDSPIQREIAGGWKRMSLPYLQDVADRVALEEHMRYASFAMLQGRDRRLKSEVPLREAQVQRTRGRDGRMRSIGVRSCDAHFTDSEYMRA